MLMIIQILKWILLLAEVVIAVPILYLCIISASAILTAHKRKAIKSSEQHNGKDKDLPNFAILIPAHNEEVLLGKLLDSLYELNYPRERYTVYVVADNCTDSTATLARTRGWIRLYERFDTTKRGKGYALNWLMEQLEVNKCIHDAYVILDADSVVVPYFLHAMAQELLRGAHALQGHNTVLNTTDAPGTILRWIALTLMNHVRTLGRNGIGASSTITGNGVCLSRTLLERYPWQSYTLSEDYQYYLSLVLNGERVRYVPEALVRSHMPTTFAQMRTQDIRWEAHEDTRKKWRTAWQLLRTGLQQRDFVRLEAIAELLTPPLSLLIGSSIIAFVVSILLDARFELWLSLLVIAGLIGYIASALYLLHAPRTVYRALLYAPGFMLWKLWVYFVLSRSKKHTSEWVRTRRPTSPQ